MILVGGELSASIEPILSPVILEMWASHVSDPFISIDIIEVLEVILAKIVYLTSLILYLLVYVEFSSCLSFFLFAFSCSHLEEIIEIRISTKYENFIVKD